MNFIISEVAQHDIDEIYEYSNREFGIDQTISYLIEMGEMFNSIAQNQNIGTLRKNIRKGLFAFPYRSHMIFYHIASTELIVIVRILHGSKNISEKFKS